jgi:hypothetical protein
VPALLTHVETRAGRVLGAVFATSALSAVVGSAVAALLGDYVGIVPLLTVQGLGYVAAGGLVLAYLGAAPAQAVESDLARWQGCRTR